MKSVRTPVSQSSTNQRKEFRFASKEGLIIVSMILFSIYAIWYQIFESYFSENDLFRQAFWTLSLVVFITMIILFLMGLILLWRDRRYIMIHERYGSGVFLIGASIMLAIPLSWAGKLIDYTSGSSLNILAFLDIGVVLCILGSLILARMGGYYIVWLIGIGIYLIMSFHEGFYVWLWTGHYGPYDNFVGMIGVYVVVTSFILFLYHDLKYFYLSKVITRGNVLRRRKKYREAMKCFNKTLKIYPLFTTAWNNMGNVYFNQGQFNQAIKCYQKALYFNPDYENARDNLVVVASKAKL